MSTFLTLQSLTSSLIVTFTSLTSALNSGSPSSSSSSSSVKTFTAQNTDSATSTVSKSSSITPTASKTFLPTATRSRGPTYATPSRTPSSSLSSTPLFDNATQVNVTLVTTITAPFNFLGLDSSGWLEKAKVNSETVSAALLVVALSAAAAGGGFPNGVTSISLQDIVFNTANGSSSAGGRLLADTISRDSISGTLVIATTSTFKVAVAADNDIPDGDLAIAWQTSGSYSPPIFASQCSAAMTSATSASVSLRSAADYSVNGYGTLVPLDCSNTNIRANAALSCGTSVTTVRVAFVAPLTDAMSVPRNYVSSIMSQQPSILLTAFIAVSSVPISASISPTISVTPTALISISGSSSARAITAGGGGGGGGGGAIAAFSLGSAESIYLGVGIGVPVFLAAICITTYAFLMKKNREKLSLSVVSKNPIRQIDKIREEDEEENGGNALVIHDFASKNPLYHAALVRRARDEEYAEKRGAPPPPLDDEDKMGEFYAQHRLEQLSLEDTNHTNARGFRNALTPTSRVMGGPLETLDSGPRGGGGGGVRSNNRDDVFSTRNPFVSIREGIAAAAAAAAKTPPTGTPVLHFSSREELLPTPVSPQPPALAQSLASASFKARFDSALLVGSSRGLLPITSDGRLLSPQQQQQRQQQQPALNAVRSGSGSKSVFWKNDIFAQPPPPPLSLSRSTDLEEDFSVDISPSRSGGASSKRTTVNVNGRAS